MTDQGYPARATRTVFEDGTWWWRALIIGAVGLIPYVGAFVVVGYHLILMRETAWGSDRGLPRFSERSQILRRGVDGFVVGVVWGLVLVIPLVLLQMAWSVSRTSAGLSSLQPWWWQYAFWLPTVGLSLLWNVAYLRAAIYVKASAGLSLRGVLGLIRRSPAGFRKVSILAVLTSAAGLLLRTPDVYARYALHLSSAGKLGVTYGWGFVVGAVVAPLWLVVYAAYGLWAKEMDPATWPPL